MGEDKGSDPVIMLRIQNQAESNLAICFGKLYDQTPSWKGIPPPNPLNSGLAICSDVGFVHRLVCIALMVKSFVFDTSDPGKNQFLLKTSLHLLLLQIFI